MRQTIIAVLILFSLSACGQTKTKKPYEVTKNVDTLKIADTIPLFTIGDIIPIYEALQKLDYKTAEPFIKYLQEVEALRSKEYRMLKTIKKK